MPEQIMAPPVAGPKVELTEQNNHNAPNIMGATAGVVAYRLTGSRCRCSKCGELFNSISTFDRHRVGSFADRGTRRQCLTTAGMFAKGWSRNLAGFWIERKRRDEPRRGGDQSPPCIPPGGHVAGVASHGVA